MPIELRKVLLFFACVNMLTDWSKSAEIFGFRNLPFTVESISHTIKETVKANGFDECYIRPLLYLDGSAASLNIDAGKPALMIAVWEWKNYLGQAALEKGIRANVSTFTRHHPNVMMTKAKIAGNYVNSILAKTESVRLGFEEAIMLDPEGYVAECTGENLFMVRRGKIVTPSTGPCSRELHYDSIFVIQISWLRRERTTSYRVINSTRQMRSLCVVQPRRWWAEIKLFRKNTAMGKWDPSRTRSNMCIRTQYEVDCRGMKIGVITSTEPRSIRKLDNLVLACKSIQKLTY